MFFFRFPEKPYIAIIGDIADSKKIENRNAVQKKLKESLEAINVKYKDEIASKFIITLGDEFQGLLSNPQKALWMISEIEDMMVPTQIRFGVGYGQITTEINPEFSIGADGPAYYNAREMILLLKKKENQQKVSNSSIMIDSNDVNAELDQFMNTMLTLLTTIKKRWKMKQRMIVSEYLKNGENQKRTAEKLGIHQSSVQRGLAGADFYAYKEAMDVLSELLMKVEIKETL